MRERVDKLLDEYERGELSREEFAQAIANMASISEEPSTSAVFRARTINHVTLKVTDLERSRAFYQEMFGLPLNKRTEDGCILGLGNSFFGIYQTETAGFDHICMGIDAFRFDSIMKQLQQDYPHLKPRSLGERVFLYDPDGIKVQLSAVDYPGV